jgi:hypothetical protein
MSAVASPQRQQGRAACRPFWHCGVSISLPNCCTLLLGLLLLAVYFRPLADLDFTWQVRTGEQIIRNRSLHVVDELTYTIAKQTLPDFEWLYEVVLWAVWSGFGYAGLHLLKVLCVLGPLALVAWRQRCEGVGWHAVYLSLAVAVLALIPTWNLRPFYCTTVGLLLVSGWLRDHCTGRRRLSWETPLVMLVWTNTHPGVITGQGLLAGAIAWEWLNLRVKLNPALTSQSCWRLTLFGGLGLLASLVCPGPLQRLHYTFDSNLAHPIMRGFVEMLPLHWHASRPPFLAGLIYLVAALVGVAIVKGFRSFRLWEIALLAGVAVLGSYAYRSAQDALLVMLAVGVPRLVDLYRGAGPRRVPRLIWRLERSAKGVLTAPAFRFQPGWALLLLVLLPLAGLLPRSPGKDWPEAALAFMEREDLHGNVFADPNHGAYLVWQLGPERAHCYVDTRGFFFPPTLLEDCAFIIHAEGNWSDRLSIVLERSTDWLLLERGCPLWLLMEGQVTPRYRDEKTVLIAAEEVRRWLAR